jgi:oxalate decarboxylase
MSINRRKVLGGAGVVGAAAAAGAGVDRLLVGNPATYPTSAEGPTSAESSLVDDAARFGNPRIPAQTITTQSHLFHLGAQNPTIHDGGSFTQASGDNFPILKGQEASIVLLTLQPGGIREPHWHPSAWELNIVTSGVAAWVVIDGNGNHETFDQRVGDVVFAPQGSFHYFENRDPDDMKIVIIQNTSAPEDKDNIGIGESLSRIPPRVLSAIFGVPAQTFESFKKIDNSIVILRSR